MTTVLPGQGYTVTATRQPDTLCVTLPGPGEKSDVAQTEIVCYVRPSSAGQIQIIYGHHVYWGRPSGAGTWSRIEQRQHVDSAVATLIRYGAFVAMWATFGEKMQMDGEVTWKK